MKLSSQNKFPHLTSTETANVGKELLSLSLVFSVRFERVFFHSFNKYLSTFTIFLNGVTGLFDSPLDSELLEGKNELF